MSAQVCDTVSNTHRLSHLPLSQQNKHPHNKDTLHTFYQRIGAHSLLYLMSQSRPLVGVLVVAELPECVEPVFPAGPISYCFYHMSLWPAEYFLNGLLELNEYLMRTDGCLSHAMLPSSVTCRSSSAI